MVCLYLLDVVLAGESADEADDFTAAVAADVLSIKERLRIETEFEGVDEWNLKEDEFERAMELGLLPLPVIIGAAIDILFSLPTCSLTRRIYQPEMLHFITPSPTSPT